MKPETLKRLIQAAQTELPTLKVDAGNASTHHALMPVCEDLVRILRLVVRALIENELVQQTAQASTTVAVAQKPAAPRSIPVEPETEPTMPEIPDLDAHVPTAPAIAGLPPDAPFVPGVTNAFVTPQGSKVIEPDGKVKEVSLPAPTQSVDVT